MGDNAATITTYFLFELNVDLVTLSYRYPFLSRHI